jgi:hypothetical protein
VIASRPQARGSRLDTAAAHGWVEMRIATTYLAELHQILALQAPEFDAVRH